jgi:hypothetical protein
VDLSETQFIGASTIAMLVRARTFLAARDRTLTVRAPSRGAGRVIEIVGAEALIDPTAEAEVTRPKWSQSHDRPRPSSRRRPDASSNRHTGMVGLPGLSRRPLRTRPRGVDTGRWGTTMTKDRHLPFDAEGTVWLVADRARGDFDCYWYVGRAGDRLGDEARAETAEDTVAWGRTRTIRVRIRTADGCSEWAGSAPRPHGISRTWAVRIAASGDDAHPVSTSDRSPC